MPSIEKVKPGPGQESVWDYPRPPAVEPAGRLVQVYRSGTLVAETHDAYRVLETSHPPVYYIPLGDIQTGLLKRSLRNTFCEFKGQASYYNFSSGAVVDNNSAWYYPHPTSGYDMIKNHVAFYPSRFECFVDGERVRAQPGDFYGGWITDAVVGPFKGEPGTLDW